MKGFLKVAITLALCLLACIGYIFYWAFVDLERLPTGEYLTEQVSPNGNYTVKAYLTNGGATTSFAVRAELVYNKKNLKPRPIYWNYREETAKIVWIDDKTVAINGHQLKVKNETYDFRWY
jgi:hypothetical protein